MKNSNIESNQPGSTMVVPPFGKLFVREGPVVMTPLVEEDGLFLWDSGTFDRESKRIFLTPAAITRKFVRSFQSTWRQIPEQDRSTLTDFWQSRIPPQPGTRPRPAIEFISFRLRTSFNAAYRTFANKLLFSAFWLNVSKSAQIRNIIAHVLGHAISHAHGWYDQHACTRGECVACECRAYSYMAAWGFDPFDGVLPKGRNLNLVDRFSHRNRRARES